MSSPAQKWPRPYITLPTEKFVPAGGSVGQVLTKTGAGDWVFDWEDLPPGIPAGGTVNQVLTKDSGTDYDVSWQNVASVSLALDDLTDVTIATPTTAQLLRYNGSAWVNATVATGPGSGTAGKFTYWSSSSALGSLPLAYSAGTGPFGLHEFLPDAANSYDLGSAALYFAYVYSTEIRFAGTPRLRTVNTSTALNITLGSSDLFSFASSSGYGVFNMPASGKIQFGSGGFRLQDSESSSGTIFELYSGNRSAVLWSFEDTGSTSAKLRYGPPAQATNYTFTLAFTDGSGSNDAAGTAVIQGPLSTGTGVGGDLVINVGKLGSSGSTLQTATQAIRVFGGKGLPQVIIGTHTAPQYVNDADALLITTEATNGTNFSVVGPNSSGASNGAVGRFASCRSTLASPSNLQSGDALGRFTFAGYGNSAWQGSKCMISAIATENWSSGTNTGAKLIFRATPTASGTIADIFEIRGEGPNFLGTDGAAAGTVVFTNAPNSNTVKYIPVLFGGAAGWIPFIPA